MRHSRDTASPGRAAIETPVGEGRPRRSGGRHGTGLAMPRHPVRTPTMNAITCLLLFAVPLAAQRFYPTRHAHLPAIPGGLCFARGDLDGGGDLDLVVANDYAASQVLLNDGNGLFVDATAGRLVSPAVNDAHAIALADLDGDGDLDLVVGHEDYVGNRVYRNNGAAVFSDVTATALPTPVFDTKNLVLADFDGDGG
ncbi:MAG: hypothetical protein FJ265_21985, partial [Planctomycetes bacterium]|nr:hypothetical protein [Planctomycetota bacterium]